MVLKRKANTAASPARQPKRAPLSPEPSRRTSVNLQYGPAPAPAQLPRDSTRTLNNDQLVPDGCLEELAKELVLLKKPDKHGYDTYGLARLIDAIEENWDIDIEEWCQPRYLRPKMNHKVSKHVAKLLRPGKARRTWENEVGEMDKSVLDWDIMLIAHLCLLSGFTPGQGDLVLQIIETEVKRRSSKAKSAANKVPEMKAMDIAKVIANLLDESGVVLPKPGEIDVDALYPDSDEDEDLALKMAGLKARNAVPHKDRMEDLIKSKPVIQDETGKGVMIDAMHKDKHDSGSSLNDEERTPASTPSNHRGIAQSNYKRQLVKEEEEISPSTPGPHHRNPRSGYRRPVVDDDEETLSSSPDTCRGSRNLRATYKRPVIDDEDEEQAPASTPDVYRCSGNSRPGYRRPVVVDDDDDTGCSTGPLTETSEEMTLEDTNDGESLEEASEADTEVDEYVDEASNYSEYSD